MYMGLYHIANLCRQEDCAEEYSRQYQGTDGFFRPLLRWLSLVFPVRGK